MFRQFTYYLEKKFTELIAAIGGGGGGVTNTITHTVDDTSTTPQPSPKNVKSFSLLFLGAGGQINGKVVPNNYSLQYGNGKDQITNTIEYTRPETGRVIITTIN